MAYISNGVSSQNLFSFTCNKTGRLFILIISLVIYKKMKFNELVGLNYHESIKVSACVLPFHLLVWKCRDKLWLFFPTVGLFRKLSKRYHTTISIPRSLGMDGEIDHCWLHPWWHLWYFQRDILLNKYRCRFVRYLDKSSPYEQRLANIWLLFLIHMHEKHMNRLIDFGRYFKEVPEHVQQALEKTRTSISIYLWCLLLYFIIVTIPLNVI